MRQKDRFLRHHFLAPPIAGGIDRGIVGMAAIATYDLRPTTPLVSRNIRRALSLLYRL